MNFSQTDIGLLLFYTAAGIWALVVLLLALPSIYKGPLKLEEAK